MQDFSRLSPFETVLLVERLLISIVENFVSFDSLIKQYNQQVSANGEVLSEDVYVDQDAVQRLY